MFILSRLMLTFFLSLGIFYPSAYASKHHSLIEDEIPLEIWKNCLYYSEPQDIVNFATVSLRAYKLSRDESLWLLLFKDGRLGTPEAVGEEPFDRTCLQIYVSHCFYNKGTTFLKDNKIDEAYTCFVNGAYGGHLLCPLEIGKLLNSDNEFNWHASLIPDDPIKTFFDREYNNLEQPKSSNPKINEVKNLMYGQKLNIWELPHEQINALIKDVNESEWPEVLVYKAYSLWPKDHEKLTEECLTLMHQALNGLVELYKNNKLSDYHAIRLCELITDYNNNAHDALSILKCLEKRKLKSIYKIIARFYENKGQGHESFELKYHRAAANRDSKNSQYALCFCSFNDHSSLEGLYWLHRSMGFLQSLEILLEIYKNGRELLCLSRPGRIIPLLSQAALSGNQFAAYKLAVTEENFTKAWEILQSLNKNKCAVLYTLAQAYEKGLGDVLTDDLDQAAHYYYRSENGNYGLLDDNGQNVDLLRLAQQGNQKAQEYLDLLALEESSD